MEVIEYFTSIMVMSGVEDGTLFKFASDDGDGALDGAQWTLTIGRRDDNDIPLTNDTFISRYHARLHLHEYQWWLEDLESTNGSYIENEAAQDVRVSDPVIVKPGQLFRIGRTWLAIKLAD